MDTLNEVTTIEKFRNSPGNKKIIGFGVLALIGIAAWIIQLTVGLDVLAAGKSMAWGVYIASFFLLAGTGGGLLILSALGDFGILSAVKMQRRSLLIAAIACFIAAGFTILMDIGRPERVLNMLFSPNFSSMFIWDFYSLGLSLILGIVCLFSKPSKILASLTTLVALALLIVEGLILTVSTGNPMWTSVLTPLLFVVEAFVTATAVALVIRDTKESDGRLEKTLAVLLLATLAVSLVEIAAVSLLGMHAEAKTSFQLLLSGNLAPFFWGQILLGILLPFVLLVKYKSGNNVKAASILAFAGIFVAKMNLLVAGQALPFENFQVTYVPSLVEWGGFIGGLGIAAFLYILGILVLPVKKGL
ncbi:MAG: polysulfide reductase NrfD [Dehalobacter sp.]|nr:polysulfide reductase NrfD [Dehalobacter sp.]